MMHASLAIVWIGLMIFIAVVAVVGLAVAALVGSARGRTALKVLLLVPAVFLVIAFLAVLSYRFTGARHEARVRHQAEMLESEAARLRRWHGPTGQVSGTITCNRRLLPKGRIELIPTGVTAGPWVHGDIVRGHFSLPKVPVGTYRVEVTANRPGHASAHGGKHGPAPAQFIPAAYNEESDLRINVDRGKTGYDLDLNVDLEKELDVAQVDAPSPDGPRGAPRPPAADDSWEVAAADPEIAAFLTRAAKAAAEESVAQGASSEEPANDGPASEKESREEESTEEESSEEKSAKEPPAEEAVAEGESAPAEERPEWVGTTPHKADGVYQMAVDVGPFSSRDECDEAAADVLRAAVDDYVATYLGSESRGRVRLPIDYVRSEIVEAEWEEQKQVRISPEGQIPEEFVKMPRLHLLLEFDRAANSRIESEWSRVVVRERLLGVGTLAVLAFVLLGGLWSYLKIDLTTGGAYRGRLRLAAAALVLTAIFAAGVLALTGTPDSGSTGGSHEVRAELGSEEAATGL